MRRRSKLSDPMDLVYGNKSNDIQGQDNSLDYLSKTNSLQGFQSADSYKQNIGYQRHMPEYKRRSSQRVGNVFWENGKKILVIVGGVLIFLVVTAFLTTYGPGILGALGELLTKMIVRACVALVFWGVFCLIAHPGFPRILKRWHILYWLFSFSLLIFLLLFLKWQQHVRLYLLQSDLYPECFSNDGKRDSDDKSKDVYDIWKRNRETDFL